MVWLHSEISLLYATNNEQLWTELIVTDHMVVTIIMQRDFQISKFISTYCCHFLFELVVTLIGTYEPNLRQTGKMLRQTSSQGLGFIERGGGYIRSLFPRPAPCYCILLDLIISV